MLSQEGEGVMVVQEGRRGSRVVQEGRREGSRAVQEGRREGSHVVRVKESGDSRPRHIGIKGPSC